MTLKESFATYTLTNDQSSLLDRLGNFLSDNSKCFLLRGYAGTGKTFMMKGLTEFLVNNNRKFRIAAPTGRAAKIISQKTKNKAYTIHRTIYSSTDLKEYKTEGEAGTETFKFYYDIKNNDDPINTVYIVDEASMLSNIYSEGEFFRFGSGLLLKDFINYINLSDIDNKKVIFIGDDAQLPPVNMNFSPALDSAYLKQNCNLVSTEYELTEIVRQKGESGILHNATKLRESLKRNIFNQLNIETNFPDITQTKHEEFLTKYTKACNNTIDEETIIIAYSNLAAKDYNDLVRNYFFPNQEKVTANDKVMIVANNYNYPQMELLNGDIGIVKDVLTTSETRIIKLKRKQPNNEPTEINVSLTFKNLIITFTDSELQKQDISCIIVENLLYSPHRELSSDELKALYIDAKIRFPKKEPAKKEFKNDSDFKRAITIYRNEFKDFLRADKYFNALRIKFGYAITCHKAQGGEWTNTFLNCKTSMGYFNSTYFRWLYTGITRAKENLYTLDEPHFQIDSSLQPPKIENMFPREDIFVLNNETSGMDVPFDLSNEISFLRNIFLAVNYTLKDANLKIDSVRHTRNLEHYTLSQGNEIVVFKIHFNNQNRITRIEQPTIKTEFINAVYSTLTQLENKVVILSEENKITESISNSFDFETSYLKDFYEKIASKTTQSGIVIADIEHKSYHEIYVFQKHGFTATYKFHYNGQGRFGKSEIIRNRTTGLVEEINELLK